VAKEVIKAGEKYHRVITPKLINRYLGPEKYKYGVVEDRDEVGLVRGLAFTEYGGDLLDIEVSIVPGKGELTVTGTLGDVMKESARAAISYVRSRADEFGLNRILSAQ